jgi:hypothetical protein
MDTITASSSFSIVTRLQAWTASELWIDPQQGQSFYLMHTFRLALEPTHSPVWLVQGAVSFGKAARAWS